MKSIRFLSLLLLLNLFAAGGYAADQPVKKEIAVSGVVTDTQKQPVAGVVVTDGVNFTQTDDKGRYQLVSDPAQSKFVYLSVPADYKTNVENALPVGYYARIDAKKKKNRCDFSLVKREQPVQDFTFIAISDLDLTMYHVIGNHDFDKQYTALSLATNKEEYGELVFGEHFGPTDYSLNVGKVHIISMKDIDYKGKKKYTEQFTPEQLEWLKKDLSYVKPGTTVLLNLHAPTANSTGRGGANARNAEQLFEILKDYKTHIFVGHTHFYENRIVTPVIYEHNIGAACGAWWAGYVNRCGAPNGYLVVNVTGDDISWQYKATGRPFDYQFRVYKPGEFQSQPKYLVVNVWDYDPAWKLSYYEDGIEKSGVMEAFDDEDQDYITMREGKATGYHTSHLFRVRPTDKAKSVKIVATNRFGQSFTQTVDLK